MLTEDSPLRIEVPRDRDATFEPLLIPKHERRFTGFDDKSLPCMRKASSGREGQLVGALANLRFRP